MPTIKQLFANLKSNLCFLLSYTGILALSLGCEKGIQRMVLLAFIACCIGCLFRRHQVPLTRNILKNYKAVLLAAVVELTFLFTFYVNFTPSVLKPIALLLHIPPHWIYLVMGVFLCAIGFYAAYLLALGCLQALRPFTQIITLYRKQLLILSVTFCIGIIGILLANYNYADDLGRVCIGNSLTGSFSRFFASFMATFLHSNAFLADVSPLPQLLAACIMALSAIVLYAVMTNNRPMDLKGFLALIPLGTFPLFLQCYTYKYDAPYMAFSILAAVLPLIYCQKGKIRFFLAACIGTILVCTTYQAASGIFPVVVIAIFLGMWREYKSLKDTMNILFPGVLGYIISMLLFRFVIMQHIGNQYVNTSIALGAILPNIKGFFSTVAALFSPVWILLIIICACSYLYSCLLTTQRSKIATLILSSIAILLMCILSIGVYLVFSSPLFAPRAMYGFAIPITLWCIQISLSPKHRIGQASTALLGCCFLIFSFVYGNALYEQNEYTRFRTEQVLTNIKDLDIVNGDQTVSVQIVDSIGHPPHLEKTFEAWPLLDQLVTVQLSDSSWYWGEYELLHFYGLNDTLVSADGQDLTQLDLPILIDNVYHTIRGNDGYLPIELKK